MPAAFMKTSFASLLTVAIAGLVDVNGQYACDIPASGCSNGMFNQARCECECIEPFCPDGSGDCTNPSNDCGGNKWKDCTMGIDCPWWINAMRAESCTSGPNVPFGIWEIYNTKEDCCKTNFANSDSCNPGGGSGKVPTKPLIMAPPEDDIYEVIPVKFEVMGLPDDVSMRKIKNEMNTVLKRIILRVAKGIDGLRISDIEEREVFERKLMKKALRSLKRDVTLYFNVRVIRDDSKRFGPIVIAEIRDSYDELMSEIRTFTDIKYFYGNDISMTLCTSRNGSYDLCAKKPPSEPTPPAPASASAPSPITVQSSGDDGGGLPGWAIALIVIIVLLLLACIGYLIFIYFFHDDRNNSKEIQNNIYFDDKSRASAYTSHCSEPPPPPRPRNVVLKEPQISTYNNKKSSVKSNASRIKRQGRDPTMYVPGQEGKPDPDSSILMITDGESSRRYYAEEAPTKPKRDPTMYIQGKYSLEDPPLKPKRDPTVYFEGQRDPTSYVEGQRDPTPYVKGQRDPSMYIDGASVGQGHARDAPDGVQFQMDASEGDSDKYDFKNDSSYYSYTDSSERNAYERHDPSYYDSGGVSSAKTVSSQEPSVASKSSKKSKKSKKSGKNKKTYNPRKSLESDWGSSADLRSSLPEIHGQRQEQEEKRQTKSFYK
mmetsp:Transcript_1311/g.2340  ORF Transcript_1311/g.2340 Transcript_1311/m.2340 type:complete len:656 (+) Transcript_1311:131-2098(+)|eukprot:CAMPEP_0183729076 /NCGR_PEP_ID=MMETSP0737-20130205/29661_1 /TAXON_ID=385413 /ORGANISM="Thalassiosira miniscula, Strain CCMP1093" /LENGTH=655 /DNA_ID=CAMNT_0025961181 /DNA_START=76 /DNA_END=2040 /DNA_ORIENTATION=+